LISIYQLTYIIIYVIFFLGYFQSLIKVGNNIIV
jgi:hypothetical protein